MVKKKKKQIIIFGSNSSLARSFIKSYKNIFRIICFQKKNKNNYSLKDINEEKNLIEFKNKNLLREIKKCNTILIFIGKFQKIDTDFSNEIIQANFAFNYKLLNALYKLRNNFKSKCKCIIIGSMNSKIPNKNCIMYSASKAALNKSVDNFQTLTKNCKLTFQIISPGPIKTKMRKYKENNFSLSPNQVNLLIHYMIKQDHEVIHNNIQLFSRKSYFNIY